MSRLREYAVAVGGERCRVWEKGEGKRLGYFPGPGGLPKWTPFLDRLADERRVIVPSLPGTPGAPAFRHLDSHLDWMIAVQELADQAGLTGADLVGVSVGGALAADVAAIWPARVRHLVLIAPFGLFDEAEPVADLWAQKPGQLSQILCADPAIYDALFARPEEADEVEWEIVQVRAMEAAGRLLWPVGDTRLVRRLHRVREPALLLRRSAN